MPERKSEQPYAVEEILSFDRIKRAMTTRILERVEDLWQRKEPINPEEVNKMVEEEWQKVKVAVRSSPAAREAFRKYLERSLSEHIDKLIKQDKAELESLGVVEKGL